MYQERNKKSITICVPVYNEEKYISIVIKNISEFIKRTPLKSFFNIDVLIIDDGSTDSSLNTIKVSCEGKSEFKYISKDNNGKGSTLIKAIEISKSDYIVIHDSDLEYKTNDLDKLFDILKDKNSFSVVFGSRYLKNTFINSILFTKNKNQSFLNYYFNSVLSLIYLLKFRVFITDSLTAFKLYPVKPLKNHNFLSSKFSTEHEITCLLFKKKVPYFEVPISYTPRSVEEGKKISYKDGFEALWRVLTL